MGENPYYGAMAQDTLFGGEMPPVFSVGEFLDFVNELLGAQDFFVVGEVIGARPHPTGMYFSLKDKNNGGVMDCYMSPYAYRGLGFPIEDGMELKVGGSPSIYKPKGRFSFKVETLEVAGEGALKKAYELLKKKLTDEGIFERKRPLPEFIRRVGLITSKTGAVIDDFRRNLLPLGIQVIHADVRVEGAQAADQIIKAVSTFDRRHDDIDVLVVIRGGGSMEDLQAFNNEHVVRAVFGARVPTIISIGHDRDVPLAQMAADASASTPTATAHTINASWDRLRTLDQKARQIEYAFESTLSGIRADVGSYTHRLATQLARLMGRGRELEQHLHAALSRVGHGIERMCQTVEAAERHLTAASPERLLKLGYSIATDESGAVIRSASQLRHGQTVTTRLGKGAFTAEVTKLTSE
jgi:exodeoxyribonuclease VII large subunit